MSHSEQKHSSTVIIKAQKWQTTFWKCQDEGFSVNLVS